MRKVDPHIPSKKLLRNELKSRKIIKKRKKAQFPLPSAPVEVRSLPPAPVRPPRPRLQRTISTEEGNSVLIDFEPLFDLPEDQNPTSPYAPTLTPTTTSTPIVSSLPRNPFGLQPRGEGFRLQYTPPFGGPVQPSVIPYDPRRAPFQTAPPAVVVPEAEVIPSPSPRVQPVGGNGRREVPLTRRRFKTRPTPGGRYYVVKRRRRPNSVASNRRNEDNEVEVVEAKTSVAYQTDKAFHHEAVLENGERHGEYGYIDPIGVRRVVTYATGPRETPGGILKGKENDYVGKDTYFEAN